MALEEHKYDAAETWFRRVLYVDPRNAKAHFLLARTLLAKGDHEEAQREIDIAVRLSPNQREFKELKLKIESGSQR
jgi:Tfp pilus assembly protein PilF